MGLLHQKSFHPLWAGLLHLTCGEKMPGEISKQLQVMPTVAQIRHTTEKFFGPIVFRVASLALQAPPIQWGQILYHMMTIEMDSSTEPVQLQLRRHQKAAAARCQSG